MADAKKTFAQSKSVAEKIRKTLTSYEISKLQKASHLDLPSTSQVDESINLPSPSPTTSYQAEGPAVSPAISPSTPEAASPVFMPSTSKAAKVDVATQTLKSFIFDKKSKTLAHSSYITPRNHHLLYVRPKQLGDSHLKFSVSVILNKIFLKLFYSCFIFILA